MFNFWQKTGVKVFNRVLKTVWKTIQMVKQHIKIVQKRYFLCYLGLYYYFFSTFVWNSVLKTVWKVLKRYEMSAKARGWNPAPTDLLFINGLMYTQSRALSFRSESEESHIDSDCVVMRFFANQRFALNDRIIVCG